MLYKFRLYILSLSVFFPLSLLTVLPSPARAGSCLQDFRNISAGAHQTRLRDYYCRGTSGQRVRVRFHRVSDFVASAMLEGHLPPTLEPILGQPRLIRNNVYEEFKTLMDRFGGRHKWLDCEKYTVIAAGGGDGLATNYKCYDELGNTPPMRRTLGGWHGGNDPYVFPAAGDLKSLELRGTVPSSYNSRWVTPEYGEPYKQIWRYVERSDLTDYKAKLRAFNRYYDAAANEAREPKMDSNYLAMLEYIARDGVPKKFMVIYGSHHGIADCQGYPARWVLVYTERAMLADLAIIENVSDRPLSIGQLAGAKARSLQLRPVSHSVRLRGEAAEDLALDSIRLEPGQKALLFQRLAYTVPKGSDGGFKLPAYVYGPEVLLKRLVIDGEEFDLEGASANYVELTAGVGGGSCPFLYAWREKVKDWVNYGKMLDKAKGLEREQSERKSFEGFVSRFRIAEEEAELAHLDKVSLKVELKSGYTLMLKPDVAKLRNTDKKRLRLYYGERVEINFTLPQGWRAQDVARSTITLTGYYERYSAMKNLTLLERSSTLPLLSGLDPQTTK